MRVGIALGSNLGDRIHNLRMACESLRALHEEPGPFLRSAVYETTPIDCPPGSPNFLNAAVELTSTLAPLDLLHRLQRLEQTLGRPADHAFHSPRTIDLDLLYCDSLTFSLQSLTLPHPRIMQRSFVIQPLADICPDRVLPGAKCSIRAGAQALAGDKSISRTDLNLFQ